MFKISLFILLSVKLITMKQLLIALPFLLATSIGFSQATSKTKTCDSLVLNLDKGTLNGLKPTATQQQIKVKLPCFTGTTKDGDAFNCGGGIFYLNHDVFFYTTLDIINVRDDFAGKIIWKGKSIDLIGADLSDIEKWFGEKPAAMPADEDANNFAHVYKTKWGSIRVDVKEGKVAEIVIGFKAPTKLKICE
jgi:hypothetical protein